ncbi:MAG: class II fructose-bisphosphate aldolase [Alphaproteobacteria bacterium]
MARAVLIHSLDHARAAISAAAALGQPVVLVSAPHAAAYAGAGWFFEVIAMARAEQAGVAVTAVLDCGDKPGLVLAALRRGIRAVRFTGRGSVRAKLESIAEQYGAVLYRDVGPALDLAREPDPERACRDWLAIDVGG